MADRSGDLLACAILCVQDAARLLFNYLRLSSNYWTVSSNPVHLRSHKCMPEDRRAAMACFRRYGDVFNADFDQWEKQNKRLFENKSKSNISLHRGTESSRISADDHFVHVQKESELPTTTQWMTILSELRRSRQARVLAGRVRVRTKSLWKILHLIYTRAAHPDLDQWRVGAMVKLVKPQQVGQEVDPWAARSKRGVEHIRRTLNIMVRRLLDRGAVIAENASRNLFPSDAGVINERMRFNFDDEDFRARILTPCRKEAEFVKARVLLI